MLFNEANWEKSQHSVACVCVCTGVCREHLLLALDNKCQFNPKNPSRTGRAPPTERGARRSHQPLRQTHRLARINSWACLPVDRRDAVENLAVCWGLCCKFIHQKVNTDTTI